MNLNDLPFAVGDPIDTLFGFHRRVERQLANLGALSGRLATGEVDAESIAAAASLVDFFSRAMSLHHADERDVLRALAGARRNREAVEALADRLEARHREIASTWRPLERSLGAVSAGASRRLPEDLVRYFRASHAVHISIEESALHVAALALSPAERGSVARGMAARRTRSYRFQ